MKHKDVIIGQSYLTRVSGEIVEVKVVGTREAVSGQKTRFQCIRMNASRTPLPKARTAAALRPLRAP